MIGLIAARLVAWGAAEKTARIIAWAALVLLAIGAVLLAIAIRDRSMIAEHDARQAVQVERDARAADGAAATERRADDTRLQTEKTDLEKVTADAPSAPVSDARRAYLRCVRLQQDARAHGDRAPACN